MQTHKTACPQHDDPLNDCMCSYISPKKRVRGPIRTVKLHDPRAPHGCRQDFIVRLFKDGSGRIEVREKGRKIRYQTTVGELYTRLVRQKAMA